jgi:hypothetical protein
LCACSSLTRRTIPVDIGLSSDAQHPEESPNCYTFCRILYTELPFVNLCTVFKRVAYKRLLYRPLTGTILAPPPVGIARATKVT